MVFPSEISTYGGWLRNPINHHVYHLSTGAGFLPSTVFQHGTSESQNVDPDRWDASPLGSENTHGDPDRKSSQSQFSLSKIRNCRNLRFEGIPMFRASLNQSKSQSLSHLHRFRRVHLYPCELQFHVLRSAAHYTTKKGLEKTIHHWGCLSDCLVKSCRIRMWRNIFGEKRIHWNRSCDELSCIAAVKVASFC